MITFGRNMTLYMERNEGIPKYDIATIRERCPQLYAYSDQLILMEGQEELEVLYRPPFRFSGFAFLICRQGVLTASVNQCEYRIAEKMVIVTFPDDIVHIVRRTDDFNASIILASNEFIRNLRLDMHQVIPLFIKTKSFPVVRLDSVDEVLFNNYWEQLYWAMGTGESPFKSKILDAIASALIYSGGNLIREQLQAQLTSDLSKNRREMIFSEFTKLLLENYRSERGVKFYADKLHITAKYLSSLIKDVSGRSAAEWIDDYVIVEAKNLLKFSNMNIQEIAYSLNFDTQSFFGKYFKQHTGYSPSQFKMLK